MDVTLLEFDFSMEKFLELIISDYRQWDQSSVNDKNISWRCLRNSYELNSNPPFSSEYAVNGASRFYHFYIPILVCLKV
jgi:hypothetical protein